VNRQPDRRECVRDDLVLCAGTLRAASLADKCAAAVAGGFTGITLWPSDVARARSEGSGLADMKHLIADHGLALFDLDALLVWLPGEQCPPGLPTEAEFAREIVRATYEPYRNGETIYVGGSDYLQ